MVVITNYHRRRAVTTRSLRKGSESERGESTDPKRTDHDCPGRTRLIVKTQAMSHGDGGAGPKRE